MGKLYLSPGSTDEKIKEAYEDIKRAVQDKILTDVAGRNALLKVQAALGKTVSHLQETQDAGGRRSASRSISASYSTGIGDTSAMSDEKRATPEPGIKEDSKIKAEADIKEEPDGDGEADTSAGTVARKGKREKEASIVDQLPSGED